MTHSFCSGYSGAFAKLVRSYPDETVFPPSAFRTEWGPIFHRGRLNGSARILVVGQDPAAHENVARRILVGEAGQRVQGFLWKLGLQRSYAMINASLYSMYDQAAAAARLSDPAIVAYRHQWIDALVARGKITAILTLGNLADQAVQTWRAQAGAAAGALTFVEIVHPTADAHGMPLFTLLANWNAGLASLSGKVAPDRARSLVPYGTTFKTSELREIPERDLPPGLPPWMRAVESWAVRPTAPGPAPATPEERAAAARYERRHLLLEAPETAVP